MEAGGVAARLASLPAGLARLAGRRTLGGVRCLNPRKNFYTETPTMSATTLARHENVRDFPNTEAAADAPSTRPSISRKAIAAAVAGNALEFYDFVIYAYFAVYIGKTFFPVSGEFGSLLAAVAIFGVGFFTRPLGGVLIGAFAD